MELKDKVQESEGEKQGRGGKCRREREEDGKRGKDKRKVGRPTKVETLTRERSIAYQLENGLRGRKRKREEK